MPSFRRSRSELHFGATKPLPNSSKIRYDGPLRRMTRLMMNMIHAMTAVASAQPGPPIAGMPNPPKMNSALSGSFSARAAICSAITIFGRPIAVFSDA